MLRTNANAALVFEYCYRFITIAKSYFGKVDEESVKNNFVLIYELIDGMIRPECYSVDSLMGHVSEINDFGYPQNSEIDTLKSYITTESVMSSAHIAVRSFRTSSTSEFTRVKGRVCEDHRASDRRDKLATW